MKPLKSTLALVNMSLEQKPNNLRNRLADRSEMLAAVRCFFAEKNILEVDCPILSLAASVDTHIDLIPATLSGKTAVYLHSSPEYGMKQLLSQGSGDIYQLSHVFRDEEIGPRHHPEFMMIEWYRLDFSFQQMIDETAALCRLFVGELPCEFLSYREAFLRHLEIDPFHASDNELLALVRKWNLDYRNIENEGRDAWLNALLGGKIETNLGKDSLTALVHYPASQAALAKTKIIDGANVAERFEIYYQGIELANGYHELSDASEQERRFQEANKDRLKLGKKMLPIDHAFLEALKKGLPDCCGVAVGFDRLMMLRSGKQNLDGAILLRNTLWQK